VIPFLLLPLEPHLHYGLDRAGSISSRLGRAGFVQWRLPKAQRSAKTLAGALPIRKLGRDPGL
jgi:hypothetical protein